MTLRLLSPLPSVLTLSISPRLLSVVAPAVIAVPAPAAQASALPAVAQAVRPALQGKAAWTGLFDGQPRPTVNAVRTTLDSRAAGAARLRAGVERREVYPSVEGRQGALLEAATRWQRLLAKPLDAKRALDLAGEVRNHREVYLSEPDPGLPGYARAAEDLVKLETVLAALNAVDARSMVELFREDIIHRRSLRVSIVLRQKKTGGTNRLSTRFALPGTTLGTLLKRIGGRPQKPEVRINGGDWTPWAKLNLRGKLSDKTQIEILLPE